MKYALIIPDGAADERQDSLGGRTPLEAARVPQMDAVARAGLVGQADHVPVSMPSGSDVGTMSLFGYDRANTTPAAPRSKRPLKASNWDPSIGPSVAIWCTSPTGGCGASPPDRFPAKSRTNSFNFFKRTNAAVRL